MTPIKIIEEYAIFLEEDYLLGAKAASSLLLEHDLILARFNSDKTLYNIKEPKTYKINLEWIQWVEWELK